MNFSVHGLAVEEISDGRFIGFAAEPTVTRSGLSKTAGLLQLFIRFRLRVATFREKVRDVYK